jgi:Ca2+-binding EF-hand superfamily protein
MRKVLLIAASVLAGMGFLGTASIPAYAGPSVIKRLDADNDGTLDAQEIGKAAGVVFDRLDKDQDSTLDYKELGSRISKKNFSRADPDNDETLTKDEYVAFVQKLFKEADVDREGTIDATEMNSKAGQALTRLVK